jgi:hypothetical protein
VSTAGSETRPAFVWNPGAWFGCQVGCTLWLAILGGVLLPKDRLAAYGCLAGFLALNAWGVHLWRRRGTTSAYAALQRFLLGASVVIAAVVVLVNLRGVSLPPGPGAFVSTYVPYWAIAVAPTLMLAFHLRHRAEGSARAEPAARPPGTR